MNRILSISILLILLLASCNKKIQTSKTPTLGAIGKQAMISSAHPLATKVGVSILKKGGNAFDAAISVQFALAVVFPRAGNIGGGGFAVFRKSDGTISALDYREKAPKSSHRDMYLDKNGNVIPNKSTLGHLAAGVPGAVDGMFKIHEKYGSLPMKDLIQPAIDLAANGFVLTENAANLYNRYTELFKEINGEDFFMSQKKWKKGDRIKYTDLSKTLTAIRDNGRNGFYGGKVADLIVKEMKSGGGIITKEDLMNYNAKWRTPVTGKYRGNKIISMSPPSSGGIALIQLLQGAEQYNIQKMGHNTAKTIHILTELERRVYADRATHLGDPDFWKVPQKMLLSNEYNTKRFSDINKKKKTDSQDIKEGKVDIIESVETTHFSVVDKNGNAVSVTTTLNGYFGCKVMVDGAGFFLNNEMDDFSSKPGVPNMFGLVGGEANAIAPEKRMLSSMTPTIVEDKNGKLKMVVGTPGGSTIITSVFQTIMNVIDHKMTMQDAVDAKRIHSQWLPDRIIAEENSLSESVRATLQKMGHEIEDREPIGRMDCILVLPDGRLEGGADRTRADNYAEGY